MTSVALSTDLEQDWKALSAKLAQLEAEIHKSNATREQRADMLHTTSKARIFASDLYDRARRGLASGRRG